MRGQRALRGFLWAFLIAPPTAVHAQTAADSAAIVTREYLHALRDERWADAAARIHPETLAEIKRRRLESIRCQAEARRPTLEQFMQLNPDMPRDVALFLFRRDSASHAAFDSAARAGSRFPASTLIDELESMSPVAYELAQAQRAYDHNGISYSLILR